MVLSWPLSSQISISLPHVSVVWSWMFSCRLVLIINVETWFLLSSGEEIDPSFKVNFIEVNDLNMDWLFQKSEYK